jgi:hypothetical protein
MAGGESFESCGFLLRTALSRGRSRITGDVSAMRVTTGGAGKPTGRIVRPVLNGATSGGAER